MSNHIRTCTEDARCERELTLRGLPPISKTALLTVTLLKNEEARPKQINVKVI